MSQEDQTTGEEERREGVLEEKETSKDQESLDRNGEKRIVVYHTIGTSWNVSRFQR